MPSRPFLAVIHYDGAQFAGWQRQPSERTVQAELEAVLERLFGERTTVTGAGRTDTGVHAVGQGAGFNAPERWSGKAPFHFSKALGRPYRLKAGKGQRVNESAQFQRAALSALSKIVEDLKVRFLVA